MLDEMGISLMSLNDFSDSPNIEEDGNTFFDNAHKKAKIIADFTGETVLADDSGLEVDYLGGGPGVRSSRYSGEDATDEGNIRKLLDQMKDVPAERRDACFKCVLVLYHPDGRFKSFEGSLHGRISDKPIGESGFGYDPVFIPEGHKRTFAEMSGEEKDRLSHRGKALAKLAEFLHSFLRL